MRLTVVRQVLLKMVGRQLFCCCQEVRGLLRLKTVPQMVLTMVGTQFFSSPAHPGIPAWGPAPQIERVRKVTRYGDSVGRTLRSQGWPQSRGMVSHHASWKTI